MPVQVPFFTGHKLSINLAEETVILRGSKRDDGTYVLRGEVELVVTKPVNVTSVSIRLVGKSFTLWTEGLGSGRNSRYSYEKKIHEQDLVLQTWAVPTSTPITSRSSSASSFKSTKSTIKGGGSSSSLLDDSGTSNNINNSKNTANNSHNTLSAGLHRWPFEMILSNQLVETIEDETGKVFYYLTAAVHRPSGIQSKIKCRRNILVLRTPHWSDNALTANSLPTMSIISERHTPACDATICVEKSMASSGTQFPIDITLAPNMKNVFLESISVLLSERRVYRLPEFDARRGEMYDFKMRLLSITNLSDMTTYSLPEDEEVDLEQRQTPFDQKLRRALFTRNAHVPLTGDPFQFRFLFNLPNCIEISHSSTFSEIDIRHFLKIAISIQSPEGPSTIRLDTNITVLDCRLKEDYAALPTYEAALSDATVDTEDEAQLSGNRSGFFICPCYLDYKKRRQVSSKKEWLMMRHNNRVGDHQGRHPHGQQEAENAPPAYDTIIPIAESSQNIKI